MIDQKLPDELEQPPGAGLQHRLLVAVPLAAARRADPARHRGLARRSPCSELISDMEDAGTVDLRGDRVLPWILKVINKQPVSDPALQSALQKLKAVERVRRAPHRPKPGRRLRPVARRCGSWTPGGRGWSRPSSSPRSGQTLFNRIPFGHDAPGPIGSAFDTSSYGYVQKDLRDLLGARVKGPYSRVYCGHGKSGRVPQPRCSTR